MEHIYHFIYYFIIMSIIIKYMTMVKNQFEICSLVLNINHVLITNYIHKGITVVLVKNLPLI